MKFGLIPSLLSAVVLLPVAVTHAQEYFGRARLMVVHSSGGDEIRKTRMSPFGESAEPGPGRELALFLDASTGCKVVVASFNREDGALTKGWKPRIEELEAGKEKRVPAPPETWDWTGPAVPFEFYVIFMCEGEDSNRIAKMVSKIEESLPGSKLLLKQTRKLRKTINGWLSERFAHLGREGKKVRPAEYAGRTRALLYEEEAEPKGVSPPDSAEEAQFGAKEKGFLVFTYPGLK